MPGPKFARHGFGNGAQSELGRGKGGVAIPPASPCGCTGKEDLALPMLKHQPRRFAPRHEAGEAGHLPDLAEHAIRRLKYGKIHIGPHIENGKGERCQRVRFGKESGDIFWFARIQRSG